MAAEDHANDVPRVIQIMALRRHPVVRLVLLIVVVAPVAAWFIVKPIRVIAPAAIGISCPTGPVCVDDVSRQGEASRLYAEALSYVSTSLGTPSAPPKMIFCSTAACADSFGLGARSAVTLGRFGTVIGPRAWKPFYVRHEMIHYLQGERLGVLKLLLKPSWLVEGMAYALSEDPREPLTEPFETYRREFRRWYDSVGNTSLWARAAEI